MRLSRKREKELKRLKSTASDLWDEQREVLDHATTVVREASRQLGNVSREEVAPRVRGAVDNHLRPAVSSTVNAARSVVGDARAKVVKEVLPGVSAALASAIATLETAQDPRVREAMRQVHKTGDRVGRSANKALSEASKRASSAYTKVGTRVGFIQPPKKSLGAGGYVLIAVGALAVVGLAYAAWQTLRADDELWVVDESDEIDTPA